MKNTKVTLVPLTADDREQFILDNQWAFNHAPKRSDQSWGFARFLLSLVASKLTLIKSRTTSSGASGSKTDIQ